MYSKGMMDMLIDLEKEVIAGNKLRKILPPQILKLNSLNVDNGYQVKCNRCGGIINALFGDYTKPLANKYFKCPGSAKGEEHGIFASAINLILN
jgi:hypothetical protein